METKAAYEQLEQKILAIMDELSQHNDDIGAPARDPDKLRCDAEWVLRYREGVSPKTLCMIITDTEFTFRRERDVKSQLRAACEAGAALIGAASNCPQDPDVRNQYLATLKLLRAAIAKARGLDQAGEVKGGVK